MHIICAKYKNDGTKDNGYTGCRKMEYRVFFIISEKKFIGLYLLLCYGTMSTLPPSVVRDTDNNLLSGILTITCCQGN